MKDSPIESIGNKATIKTMVTQELKRKTVNKMNNACKCGVTVVWWHRCACGAIAAAGLFFVDFTLTKEGFFGQAKKVKEESNNL